MKPLNDDFDHLPNVCAYCGVSPAPTWDHVIPKAFRPEIDEAHDWILVRSCNECNNKKSGFDGEVRNHLALYHEARGNIAADYFVNTKIPAEVKRLQEKRRRSPTLAMLNAMKPLAQTDGTLIAMTAEQTSDLFRPWLEYVVRGLATACTRERLADALFEVKAFAKDNFTTFLSSISPFHYVVPLGNHTRFAYDPIDLAGGYGLWVFQFFDGLGFAVLTMPTALADHLNSDPEEPS